MSCRRFFLLAALLLPGCASMEVTPQSLREAVAPAEDRELALANWTAAVELANGFLASPLRQTLPPGRLELHEEGMVFHAEERAWPIRVRCTAWGDLCLLTGFIAQERSWGFVVGKEDPGADRVIDNSFLRNADGGIASAADIASLLLHETTHVVLRQGTVSFWKGFAYYLEVIFLFRYENHSAERQPYSTNREFAQYLQSL